MIRKSKKIKLQSPKLFPWQFDVIDNIFKHFTGTIHTVKSKRQVGKSILLENILLKTACERAKSVSIVLSPTNAQCAKIFKEILNFLIKTPAYLKHNSSQLSIEFINNSSILFKSAEQRESLRGYTVSGICCIDESAYISDDIIATVMPWVDAHKSPIIFVSTPLCRQGFFYNMYMKGLEDNRDVYFSYNWADYDTSKLLSEERKKLYKQTMPKDKYITDILGEFLESESQVFGDFADVLYSGTKNTKNCYFGIDWGTGQGGDYTAISILNHEFEQIYIDYFNNLDETQTINRIVKLAKEYNPKSITVELNSIGRIFFGLLDKELKKCGVKSALRGFTTTNQSKERIVNKLQVRIQNNTIKLLSDEELKNELSGFDMIISSTGKRIYNARSGYHDDLIMATCICIDSIETGKYSVNFI